MMDKYYLELDASEAHVFRAAAAIYAAYITAGKVKEGEEDKWMEKAIHRAAKMAKQTDRLIVSDKEPG